jgi:addiction module RelE/StbE family toxin
VWATSFSRAAKRLVKTHPRIVPIFQRTIDLLAKDAFNPKLDTHKLGGRHEGAYACTVAYDLRIIFRIIKLDDGEAVLLRSMGTHDEVY